MPIRVLDAATVGRIAAGEVVERPSSIAKELIENSLDAGATSITVEIRDGGISYLRVTDNGCGIPPSEVRVAFENHATSKIASGDTLNDIRTLGFRGEALPSIAAVARVTITTRTKGAASGVRMTIEGGKVTEFTDIGCPEGTSIVVKDLFYNTPVRREFLKKPTTEAGVVADLTAKLILGNPHAAIRLINGGRTVYHSYGDGNMRHAALAVYGRQTAQELVEVKQGEGALTLTGLIGVGDQGRSNRSHQSFFINGRVVRCPLLTQALEEATKGLVMIGMYPMCALSLQLPLSAVDINVHPNKLEVRFKDEELVRTRALELLNRALDNGKMLPLDEIARDKPALIEQHSLREVTPVQEADAQQAPAAPQAPLQYVPAEPLLQPSQVSQENLFADATPQQTDQPTGPAFEPIDLSMPHAEMQENPVGVLSSRPSMPVSPDIPHPAKTYAPVAAPAPKPNVQAPVVTAGPLRVIGVFANTYILVEWNDTLIMIDQHAAHERLRFIQYEKALHQGTAMQQLLTPVTISLSQSEFDLLMSNKQLLFDAGYEVEPFGERAIRVTAVPHVLGQADMRMLFMELIDQLSLLKSATIERRRAEVIQASCKHAVKGGDALTPAEIEALLTDMLNTDAPSTCPHGRPVYKAFKRTEVERMFKRIV